jgi:hypothetical protein
MAKEMNLAMISKRQKRMNDHEMAEIRAGDTEGCVCDNACDGDPFHYSGFHEDLYYRDVRERCPCGSVWTFFGLLWGPKL